MEHDTMELPILPQPPAFDSLPVRRFASFSGDSRLEPLAYAQGCWVQGEGLWLRFLLFESTPPDTSQVEGELDGGISFSLTPQQAHIPPGAVFCREGGENLEGVFWGGVLQLPASLFDPPHPGSCLRGQVVKSCTEPRWQHRCSLFSRQGTFLFCPS